MKAVLVDDERSNLENLSALLGRYCPFVQVAGTATTVQEAFDVVAAQKPDLVFLDIQLKDETGFDLLRKLGEPGFELIFVTAYDQYGIQAIKFAALDYLLKPVDIAELKNAVAKAQSRLAARKTPAAYTDLLQYLRNPASPPRRIALPLMNETRYIEVSEITRCEADNTYTWFVLQSGEKLLVSRTLKEYADLLSPYGFVRAHQSHLVHPRWVSSWLKEDGGTLLLKNGTRIPVSKPNRETVKAALGN